MKFIAIIDECQLTEYEKTHLLIECKNRNVALKPIVKELLVTKDGESVYLTDGHIECFLDYEQKEKLKAVLNANPICEIHPDIRDCEHCIHYVSSDGKAGCELWECEFEEKLSISETDEEYMVEQKAELGKWNELTVQTDSVLEEIIAEIRKEENELKNYDEDYELGQVLGLKTAVGIVYQHISRKENE